MSRLVNVPATIKEMVIIRQEYLAITNGDACAAALLYWFERWAEWLRDNPARGEWVRVKNQHEIGIKLLGVFTHGQLKTALRNLRAWGFIKTAKTGAHKYDQRLMYALDVRAVQDALDAAFQPMDWSESTDALDANDRSIGQNQLMDKSNSTNALAVGDQSSLDQKENQNLLDQKENQKAAAEDARARANDAAAAADSITDEMRESGFTQPNVFKAETHGAPGHTPPSSAAPPLCAVTALGVFTANMGKAGDVVQRGIAAAVARYGEPMVIRKIEQAAKKGGRTWAYVETMLADVPAAKAWNAGADAVDRPDERNAYLDGWDGKGSLLEYMQRQYGETP